MKRRAVDAAVMGLNPDIRSNPELNIKNASLDTKTTFAKSFLTLIEQKLASKLDRPFEPFSGR